MLKCYFNNKKVIKGFKTPFNNTICFVVGMGKGTIYFLSEIIVYMIAFYIFYSLYEVFMGDLVEKLEILFKLVMLFPIVLPIFLIIIGYFGIYLFMCMITIFPAFIFSFINHLIPRFALPFAIIECKTGELFTFGMMGKKSFKKAAIG